MTTSKFLYKRGIKAACLGFALIATAPSCKKDFLEAVPETSVSVENAFDTPPRVLAQINGLYASAKTGTFLGGRYLIYNDIRAEDFFNRDNNVVTGTSIWNHTAGSDDNNVTNLWIQAYLTINRCNIVLKGLDDNATKIDPLLLPTFKAEAKFVRALTYFYLVQIYARPYILDNGASPAIPLRLIPETTSENNALPRSTVAQVYTQILKDLNEAEPDIVANYATAVLNTTRAHKSTVIALKARVYKAMGRYADVITEANKIVSATAPFTATTASGVAHALQPSITTVFTTFTTVESILSMPMADTNAPGTQNQLGFYYNGAPNGQRLYYINSAANAILSNPQWGANDVRRTGLTATIEGLRYLTKFRGTTPFVDWVPLFRYSEVLLTLAEAEARAGNQTRAIALLEAVHKRSDASYTYTGTTQQALITAIVTERRIELLGEGFRSNDVLGRGESLPSSGTNGAVPTTAASYIFPIPTIELQRNPGL